MRTNIASGGGLVLIGLLAMSRTWGSKPA